jgi:inhibitor of KinA
MSSQGEPPVQILPLGDCAAIVEFAAAPSRATTARVCALANRVRAAALPGVRDVVPAFRSVTVHYDPVRMAGPGSDRSPFDRLREALAPLLRERKGEASLQATPVEIPVCYGGEFGEDLEVLGQAHGLSPAEVVRMHSAAQYFVGMLGFAPGFPYLVGLDARLVTPRRATPRARVPRGSVAIGGEHTGIYPFESPGGWHVIGRTPLELFDPTRDPPSLLQAGDEVRFVPISGEQFSRIERERTWR